MRTERLLLRPWRPEDREPFAAMNADPVVMEHFPAPMTREESDAFVDRIEAHFAERGYGLWVVDDGEFCGFTGLNWATFDAPFNPSLEVGWRLKRTAWGKGYATEAALVSVRRGLEEVKRITSFTALTNARSYRVMERIGMRRELEFDHPRVPAGSPIRPHVLYVTDRDTWAAPA
jgi:ribosomal-protein-alanine N-acetyltransferase